MVVRPARLAGCRDRCSCGTRSARPEISSRHRPRRATSDPGAETTTAPVPRSFLAYEPEAPWDGRWKPAFRVVDFFCGCGGTSLGLVESGGRVILGIDNDPHASATFRRNFPTAAFIEGDIRAIPLEAILPRIQRTGKSPLLFCGCAPCQPFSRQNRQRGHQGDDPRTELLDIFCSFVRRYLPDLVLIENVAGIRDFGPRSPIDAAQAILRRHGYKTRLGSLDAQDYGVPQRRRRVFQDAERGRLASRGWRGRSFRHSRAPRLQSGARAFWRHGVSIRSRSEPDRADRGTLGEIIGKDRALGNWRQLRPRRAAERPRGGRPSIRSGSRYEPKRSDTGSRRLQPQNRA